MAISKYAAYAGQHEHEGKAFIVRYLDRAAITAEFGEQRAFYRKHKCGWYWKDLRNPAGGSQGHYSSSRAAFLAARDKATAAQEQAA